jgi:hypothetical protein
MTPPLTTRSGGGVTIDFHVKLQIPTLTPLTGNQYFMGGEFLPGRSEFGANHKYVRRQRDESAL